MPAPHSLSGATLNHIKESDKLKLKHHEQNKKKKNLKHKQEELILHQYDREQNVVSNYTNLYPICHSLFILLYSHSHSYPTLFNQQF